MGGAFGPAAVLPEAFCSGQPHNASEFGKQRFEANIWRRIHGSELAAIQFFPQLLKLLATLHKVSGREKALRSLLKRCRVFPKKSPQLAELHLPFRQMALGVPAVAARLLPTEQLKAIEKGR
ncbi:hypothetical protein [Leisingera sp. JC1]|uniref:hypothetical protein n=1 Tax=Leisingera sp. JC1 TaxID=1855282 RepID=UPI0011303F65|nr:hypothetical protein [Leisingera sp. JC1]